MHYPLSELTFSEEGYLGYGDVLRGDRRGTIRYRAQADQIPLPDGEGKCAEAREAHLQHHR